MRRPFRVSTGLALALAFASMSHAAPPIKDAFCKAPERAIHTCDLSGGRHVAICLGPNSASYVFGRTGKAPELTLQAPKTPAWLVAHAGTGADDSHYIFRNGRTAYLVSDYHYFDDPEGRESSVVVRDGKKTLATLPCKRSSIRHEDGVDPSDVLELISDTDAEAQFGPLHD